MTTSSNAAGPIPDWCRQLSAGLFDWLLTLRGAHPGWFAFCRRGNRFRPGPRRGLDASALALKITTMAGLLERIQPDDLQAWTEYIAGFQHEEFPFSLRPREMLYGYFLDRSFLRRSDFHFRWRNTSMLEIRRAVTRQACAALLGASALPRFPVLSVPDTPEDLDAFLSSLDWKAPWGAGSHASHLIFFYHLNSRHFGLLEQAHHLIPAVLQWLEGVRHPEDGCWYQGQPPLHQKINGAMKVLTGLAVIRAPLAEPDRLIDFALQVLNDSDGCHNADIIFVLHYCCRFTDHRRDEIEAFCRQRLPIVQQFLQPEGGFSFYPQRAQDRYYGVRITRGLEEADLHGTTLFLWTLVMIADLLGWREELGWQLPVT